MQKFDRFPHVVAGKQFPKHWLENTLFPIADEMEQRVLRRDVYKPLLGKEMVSLFIGESLRTRARFIIAMQRLGGALTFDSEAAGKYSSIAKGESLEDTIVT